MSQHVSFSELKNWKKCPYYHKLIHLDKLKGFEGNEHTAFGSAIHEVCEETIFNTEDPEVLESKFQEFFTKEVNSLPKHLKLNEKLLAEMKGQGKYILPEVHPALKEAFGNFEVVATEEQLYQPIKEYMDKKYDFKGFIDLVIKTADGKYHIIDWKTCSWGWNMQRKTETMTTYQLTFYKHYYAMKYDIDPANIETYFGLLKRTAKKNRVEIYMVSSGTKKIENAINFLKQALYNISNKKYIKNKLACQGQFGPCEFYKTKYCN